MAKIIKVESSTSTPRIANQFKTSRISTTNPFKYQNFEGNTLDVSAFADVFENYSRKEPHSLKLIASSIVGSMHKLRTGITEPIARFVGRIREAWDYAVNTNISELAAVKGIGNGLKNINEYINKPIELPHIDILGGIKSNIGSWHADIIGLGKDIGEGWTDLISKIKPQSHKISAETPVADLEEMWKAVIMAGSCKEAA